MQNPVDMQNSADKVWNPENLSPSNERMISNLYDFFDCLRAGRSGDRIPVRARFSLPVQTGHEAPPSFLYNGYRVFPGGKVRPGRDADPSPPSSAEVKNRVEPYFYFP